MFGAGKDGMINPPDPNKHFSLSIAEIAVFDQQVYDLIMDLTVLIDMAKVSATVLLNRNLSEMLNLWACKASTSAFTQLQEWSLLLALFICFDDTRMQVPVPGNRD